MKKLILAVLVFAVITVSCNQKSKETITSETPSSTADTTVIVIKPAIKETDTTMMIKDTVVVEKEVKKVVAEKIYSCPMHPEVQGKLNSKCSTCGMPLTVPVS